MIRHVETFHLLDELKKVHFSEEQAKVVLEVVESSRNTGFENLATKQNVSDVRLEIFSTRFELKEEIAKLRSEVLEELAKLRTEIKMEIALLKGEFKTIYWMGGAGFTLLSAIAIKLFLG